MPSPNDSTEAVGLSHPTDTHCSGVLDAGQAWNNVPSGQWLQQKDVVEGPRLGPNGNSRKEN